MSSAVDGAGASYDCATGGFIPNPAPGSVAGSSARPRGMPYIDDFPSQLSDISDFTDLPESSPSPPTSPIQASLEHPCPPPVFSQPSSFAIPSSSRQQSPFGYFHVAKHPNRSPRVLSTSAPSRHKPAALAPDADADADAEIEGVSEQPVKKRRKIEPKPRKTMNLDLTQPEANVPSEQSEELDFLLKILSKKRKIVVVAGAGISVAAGIPDFRSSHGLFTTLKREHKLRGASGKQLFDASVYSTSDLTTSFHEMVRSLSSMASNAHPTLFHHLMARLAKEGRLLRLYTQNVDGIETSLPPLRTEVPLNTKAPWPRTIQLHGGLEMMVCQKCRHTSPFQPELFSGPTPPLCDHCKSIESHRSSAGQRSRGVGRLRPRIVLYNESNPDEEAIGSVVTADLRAKPDALIVVGTSMKIPGVRRIVKEMGNMVRKGRKDGVAIWINRDGETGGKEFEWDLIVKGDCDEVARRAAFKNWDEDDENSDSQKTDQLNSNADTFEVCSTDDVNRIKREQGRLEVRIPPKKKPTDDNNADRGDISFLTSGPCSDEAFPPAGTESSRNLKFNPLRAGKSLTALQPSAKVGARATKPAATRKTVVSSAKSTARGRSKAKGKSDDKLQQSVILPGHQVKPGLAIPTSSSGARRMNLTSKNARKAIVSDSSSSNAASNTVLTPEAPSLVPALDSWSKSYTISNHDFTTEPGTLPSEPPSKALGTDSGPVPALIPSIIPQKRSRTTRAKLKANINTPMSRPMAVDGSVPTYFQSTKSAIYTATHGSITKSRGQSRKRNSGAQTPSQAQVSVYGITFENSKLAVLPSSSARSNGPPTFHFHHGLAPDAMQLQHELDETSCQTQIQTQTVCSLPPALNPDITCREWSSSVDEMDAKRQLETISPKETGTVLPKDLMRMID
ncbi:hypothetical protein KEM56_005926 [Ascosphaera pollenicola]|nr:hypothetical protein KEM56_005926 [Ascosphaera pollenicola]